MSASLKVLVVDDEQAIRRLLSRGLKEEGYEIREAASGKEGLSQAASWRPEILVLDLGLGDMEGAQFLRELRQWSPAPVLVLTVRDSDEEKVALLDAGADDYLTKPFSLPELLAR